MAKIIYALLFMLFCADCSNNNEIVSTNLRQLTADEDLCLDDIPEEIYVVPYSDSLLVMIRGWELWDVYDKSFRYCYMSYKQFRYSFCLKGMYL